MTPFGRDKASRIFAFGFISLFDEKLAPINAGIMEANQLSGPRIWGRKT